jgi:phage baseplate assembly protein W
MAKDDFLGTGWHFPPTFSRGGRNLTMVSGVEDVAESLHILFSTKLGERVMQPLYGCNLDDQLFEPVSESFVTYIRRLIELAVLYHEPRIELDEVEIDNTRATEGLVQIVVHFRLRGQSVPHNFVYPFYLNGAEND